jgi:hypothetical protein
MHNDVVQGLERLGSLPVRPYDDRLDRETSVDLCAAVQDFTQSYFEILCRGRREKAKSAKIDPEDRDVLWHTQARCAQHGAVASQGQKQVDRLMLQVKSLSTGRHIGTASFEPECDPA